MSDDLQHDQEKTPPATELVETTRLFTNAVSDLQALRDAHETTKRQLVGAFESSINAMTQEHNSRVQELDRRYEIEFSAQRELVQRLKAQMEAQQQPYWQQMGLTVDQQKAAKRMKSSPSTGQRRQFSAQAREHLSAGQKQRWERFRLAKVDAAKTAEQPADSASGANVQPIRRRQKQSEETATTTENKG